jgi:ATP-dependent Lon protease
MAREFKASTFFNKYIPVYEVSYTMGKKYHTHYSYEFLESTLDDTILDFCESRMLVAIYAVISIFENKLVVPTGRTVNLDDFSKEAFEVLKVAPTSYFESSRKYLHNINDSSFVSLISENLSDDISVDEFKLTDFYSVNLLQNEIIKKTSMMVNYFVRYSERTKMDFILAMDIKNSSRFRELSSIYEILDDEDAIDFEQLQSCSTYSSIIKEEPQRLELFKIFRNYDNKIIFLEQLFDELILSLEPKKIEPTAEDIKKKDFIDAFKAHYSLYAENNLRADTAKKIDSHYDLVDAINLFSDYPYSPRQYENQAYIPLMIKAPIKKIKATMITDLENMVHDFPHFSEIINYLVLSLKVRDLTDGILKFKHLLLVGEHGIGKNAFIRRLNEVLGYVGNSINMTSVMAPFELAGMDAGWNSSAPGFFFNSILKNNAANPIVILDDLDKVTVNPNHGNVNTAIIELIEPSNAKKYYEQFFQIDINMSYVSVIGLANNVDDIDRGVLDLLKVFNVEKPSVAAISSIVFSIYKDLKLDGIYGFTHLTDNELNELVAKFIMSKTYSPRSMRKVIEEALNNKLIETVHKKEQSVKTPDDSKEVEPSQLLNKNK